MNTFYLNIGLWEPGTKHEMLICRATASIEAMGLRPRRLMLIRGEGQEPFLVVHGETIKPYGAYYSAVLSACTVLGQDCIASYWTGDLPPKGELIGPRAADWGDFDARLFHFL
jgi:hypothetical protein